MLLFDCFDDQHVIRGLLISLLCVVRAFVTKQKVHCSLKRATVIRDHDPLGCVNYCLLKSGIENRGIPLSTVVSPVHPTL